MNILLTGSAGFVGSHVLHRLVEQGHEVCGIDNFDERVHTKHQLGVSYKDTPYEALVAADVVIHLAAQVSVVDSMTDPLRYIEQNSRDTAQFLLNLEQAHLNAPKPRRLVVASSMSVYGEGGHLVSEAEKVCPTSVYGLTKYDQERLCLMWGTKLGIPSFALRFFNVYGPGQALTNPYTGVLANFARRLLADEAPIVYEDGQQTRDFIYVDDVADAVVATVRRRVHRTYHHSPMNICTGKPTTIEQAARLLAKALKRDLAPIVTGEYRAGDIRHCTGHGGLAWRALGFTAKTSFEEGIERYGEWLLQR